VAPGGQLCKAPPIRARGGVRQRRWPRSGLLHLNEAAVPMFGPENLGKGTPWETPSCRILALPLAKPEARILHGGRLVEALLGGCLAPICNWRSKWGCIGGLNWESLGALLVRFSGTGRAVLCAKRKEIKTAFDSRSIAPESLHETMGAKGWGQRLLGCCFSSGSWLRLPRPGCTRVTSTLYRPCKSPLRGPRRCRTPPRARIGVAPYRADPLEPPNAVLLIDWPARTYHRQTSC
jgi:hypothetical protein